jgi:hypothetical protein
VGRVSARSFVADLRLGAGTTAPAGDGWPVAPCGPHGPWLTGAKQLVEGRMRRGLIRMLVIQHSCCGPSLRARRVSSDMGARAVRGCARQMTQDEPASVRQE